MIVVDTNNQTARNLSTRAVVGDNPRSRGEIQYIEELGGKGILVQIGGNQKNSGDASSSSMDDLVSFSPLLLCVCAFGSYAIRKKACGALTVELGPSESDRHIRRFISVQC